MTVEGQVFEFSSVTFRTDHSSTTIPIFANTFPSSLRFSKEVSILSNSGSLNVTNYGSSSGFFSIFPDCDYEAEIRISPQSSIVESGETIRVDFSIFHQPKDLESIQLTVFFGDEIVRQGLSETNPTSFYSRDFPSFSPLFSNFDFSLLGVELEKYVTQTQISLQLGKTSQLSISPSQVEYSPNRHNFFTLSNCSTNSIPFTIVCRNISFRPSQGVISPNDSVQIELQMKTLEDQEIEVHSDEEIFFIPVHFQEDSSIVVVDESGSFSVESEYLDFGKCEVGGNQSLYVCFKNESDCVVSVSLQQKT